MADGAALHAQDQRGYRITSLDVLRGLVIVIMALDHTRDFTMLGSQQDPTSNPHVGAVLFFTRWITHFCAPTFTCLAGISAGLMRGRKPPGALGAFLLKRGLWLVAIEVLIISSAITMAPFRGTPIVVMQTLWAIGGSMIVLAGAQFLGTRICLGVGLAIVLGHNALDPIWPVGVMLGPDAPLWVSLHSQEATRIGPLHVFWAYPLLPWVGVMLLGFGMSPIFTLPPQRRDTLLLRIGAAAIAFFLVLRFIDIYGDPRAWHIAAESTPRVVMNFLNTTKYPPSLLYLCMTLGPAAILCALSDRVHGPVKGALIMFGRVPFAFYVAHFWLIRLISLALGVAQGYKLDDFPKTFGVTLPFVYVIWIAVIVALYPFCRWMAKLKATRGDWWLSYL
jgi:uncharacterized membrane protein